MSGTSSTPVVDRVFKLNELLAKEIGPLLLLYHPSVPTNHNAAHYSRVLPLWQLIFRNSSNMRDCMLITINYVTDSVILHTTIKRPELLAL